MRAPDLRLRRSDFPSDVDWIDRLLRPLSIFAGQTQAALTKGLTFEDNIASEQVEMLVQMRSAHHEVTLTSPWGPVPGRNLRDFQPPVWRKLDNGFIYVTGSLAGGQAGTSAFTLPQSAWPLKEVYKAIWSGFDGSPLALHRARVDQAGVVYIGESAGGICDEAYLDLLFEAADVTPEANEAFPITQRITLANPVGVIPLKVLEQPSLLSQRPASKAITVDWSMQNQEFVIHDIAGLQPGKTYKVTLLVYGG